MRSLQEEVCIVSQAIEVSSGRVRQMHTQGQQMQQDRQGIKGHNLDVQRPHGDSQGAAADGMINWLYEGCCSIRKKENEDIPAKEHLEDASESERQTL